MSLWHDKQIRYYYSFLFFFIFLFWAMGLLFSANQLNNAKEIYLRYNEAVASSLLEQGVSENVVAVALTNTEISDSGRELLSVIGIGEKTTNRMLPFISQFQQSTFHTVIFISVILSLILFWGTLIFFWRRKRLYIQADMVINNYINGDYSCHLSQDREGAIFQVFSSVEQLATMLQSKNETEHKAKEFLKNTISDISHQLKTPLAALTMYQEIIENEPDNLETIKEFSAKMGVSLKRMERLIQSMLKITRLDTENIIFEKSSYCVSEVISHAINELTTRADNENKKILISGSPEQKFFCDMEWTSEAIGNIVKNALDHTKPGGTIYISWENAPTMLRLSISDNGKGIAPEDIHHIFKRFYRSKHSLDTQGIGLGLPLAKSIIEGQGGFISVQSELNMGTTFMISFLTES